MHSRPLYINYRSAFAVVIHFLAVSRALKNCNTHDKTCSERGNCLRAKESGAKWVCLCHPGWGGDFCQKADPQDCRSTTKHDLGANKLCSKHGQCKLSKENMHRCECHVEYTGWYCELRLTQGACMRKPCKNGGLCHEAVDGPPPQGSPAQKYYDKNSLYWCECFKHNKVPTMGKHCEVIEWEKGNCNSKLCKRGKCITTKSYTAKLQKINAYGGRIDPQYRMFANKKVCKCHVGLRGKDCLEPCAVGFYGELCSRQCSRGCQHAECKPTTGQCYQCLPGRYGKLCSKGCSVGCKGEVCDRSTGKCKCKPSFDRKLYYTGKRCESAVSMCVNENQCADEGVCRHVDKKGYSYCYCNRGKKGVWCEQDCDNGQYGHNCKKRCGHCKQRAVNFLGQCDVVTGKCPEVNGKICDKGYIPPYCKKRNRVIARVAMALLRLQTAGTPSNRSNTILNRLRAAVKKGSRENEQAISELSSSTMSIFETTLRRGISTESLRMDVPRLKPFFSRDSGLRRIRRQQLEEPIEGLIFEFDLILPENLSTESNVESRISNTLRKHADQIKTDVLPDMGVDPDSIEVQKAERAAENLGTIRQGEHVPMSLAAISAALLVVSCVTAALFVYKFRRSKQATDKRTNARPVLSNTQRCRVARKN